MKKQMSLVEIATYGYDPARVNKGSWQEQMFGGKEKGNERIRRSDQNQNSKTGRRSAKTS